MSSAPKSKKSRHGHPTTVIGKSPAQVERRNARERKRVQQVNQGYEFLAQQLANWGPCKNKKLTKADTLKAAIDYIRYMERLLASGCVKPEPLNDATTYADNCGNQNVYTQRAASSDSCYSSTTAEYPPYRPIPTAKPYPEVYNSLEPSPQQFAQNINYYQQQ